MMTELAIDPVKRADAEAKIERTLAKGLKLHNLLILLETQADREEDPAVKVLYYQARAKADPNDPDVQKDLVLALAAAKKTAQSNKKSSPQSSPLSSSPEANSSAVSPASSADLSRSSSEEETPLAERIAIIEEHWKIVKQGLLNKTEEVVALQDKKEAAVAEIGEIEKALQAAKIYTSNDYDKLSNFQKDRKIKGPGGVQQTKRSLMEKKAKLSAAVSTYDDQLVEPTKEFNEIYKMYKFFETFTSEKIAAFPEVEIQALKSAGEHLRERLATLGLEDQFFVPSRAPAAQQPQPPVLPPKKPATAAQVNYAWMQQQSPSQQPTQQQSQQSQFMGNAYVRK